MANDGVHDSTEVIDQEAVYDTVQYAVQENKVWRQAFRQVDSTDVNSNSVEFPVSQDATSEVSEVAEGSTYNREDEQVQKVTVSHDKYGQEVAITYEAIQDGLFDPVAHQTQDKAEAMASGLDSAAFNLISTDSDADGTFDNLNQSGPIGSASGTMGYAAVIDAITQLESEGYDPDLLVVSAESKGDLLKSDEFTRATEMGDEVIRDGAFGQIAGVEVMVENGGDLGAGEGVLFDTTRYGYESTREGITTETYEEEEKDQRVIKIRTRKGWAVADNGAGIRITA